MAGELGTVPCIRVSARARRLSIRVYPDARVEVVVPPRARPREVEQFLAAHREWIDSKRAAGAAQPSRAAGVSAARPSNSRLTGRALAAARGGRRRARLRVRRTSATAGERILRVTRRGRPARPARRRCAPGCCAPRAAGSRRAWRRWRRPPACAIRRFPSAASVRAGEVVRRAVPSASMLPAVPAARSGGLPHRARAHARQTHESLGALLAGGGTALRRLARARSRARAGLAPRAALGVLRRKSETRWPTTRSI